MQTVSQELMVIIKERLPPIVTQAKDAAKRAGTAATKAAAKSANTAVRKVEEVLAPAVPPPPATFPDWLDTP